MKKKKPLKTKKAIKKEPLPEPVSPSKLAAEVEKTNPEFIKWLRKRGLV